MVWSKSVQLVIAILDNIQDNNHNFIPQNQKGIYLMRKITIVRPKKIAGSMNSVKVDLDGRSIGSIGNNSNFDIPMDENAHVVKIYFGSGSKEYSSMPIPAGQGSYRFRVELMNVKGGLRSLIPVLRPIRSMTGEDVSEQWLILGSSVSNLLLQEEVREKFKTAPTESENSQSSLSPVFEIIFGEQGWHANIKDGEQTFPLGPYNYGSCLGAGRVPLGRAALFHNLKTMQDPAKRAAVVREIANNYVKQISGWTITGAYENGLQLKFEQ